MGFFATGHRLSPRSEGPTHEWNHDSGRFANVDLLATSTPFESEFWANRFKRLGIRPNQSENFGLACCESSASSRCPALRSPGFRLGCRTGVAESSERSGCLSEQIYDRSAVKHLPYHRACVILHGAIDGVELEECWGPASSLGCAIPGSGIPCADRHRRHRP
jgi:hypothetical protein